MSPWIVGGLFYLGAMGVALLFNYCASELNKRCAEALGEDYYGS